MSGSVIRLVEDRDWREIADLMGAVYQKPPEPEYWMWKYQQHPWLKERPLAAVTIDDGMLISFYGSIPMRFRTPGGTICGNQVLDLVTHWDHRRKGIFRKEMKVLDDAMREQEDRISVGFAIDTSPTTKGLLTMGYTQVGMLTQMIKVYDRDAYVDSASSRGKALARRVVARGRSPIPESVPDHASITDDIQKMCPLDGEWRHTPFSVARDREWLEWRIRNPRERYKVIIAHMDDVPVGYAIYSCKQAAGMKQGFIVDYYIEERTAGTKLLECVDYLACETGVATVKAQTTLGSPFLQDMKKAGYRRHAKNHSFLLREMNYKKEHEWEPGIMNERNWHITLADTDHI